MITKRVENPRGLRGQPQRTRGEGTKDLIANTIRKHVAEHGRSPSVRELADLVDLSTETVRNHVNSMVDEGRLEREGASGRELRVLW